MVRGRRTVLSLGLVLCALVVARAAPADAFGALTEAFEKLDRMTGKLFDGLQISGRGDFSLRQDFVSGSQEAYQAGYWNTSPLQAQTSFDIAGPIWGNFGVRAHIADTGYGFNDNRLMLGYQDKNTAVLWGDLNVSLTGNEFASITKSLDGWQFDQRIGANVLARAFTSREKGLVRRQTFPGNNTSGPYFLTFTPIVDGSELVKVDERPMMFGEDYTLDYDTGQLYFEPPGSPPRLIPSTSVISVSYQSATTYEGGGSTRGAQVEGLLLNDRLSVTLTMLDYSTASGGSRSTARFQEDLFQGSGSTGPFDVRFSPILADGALAVIDGKEQKIRDALSVLVDNVEQREGVDFDAIRQIGRIIFRRIVPPTAVVRIRYYYQVGPGEEGLGDTTIHGFALRHRISDGLSWDLSAAQSDGGGATGLATSAGARYGLGTKFDVDLRYRSVDPTFRYINSVGFFRNEKGLTASAGYRPNEHIQLAHHFSDVKTDSGYSYGYSGYTGGIGFGGSNVGYNDEFYNINTWQTDDEEPAPPSLDVRALRNDTTLAVTYPSWPSLNLSYQSMENSGGSVGASSNNNLSLSLDYSPPALPMTLRAGLTSSDQKYAGLPTGDEDDPVASPQSSQTQSVFLAGSWTPSERLSFAANYNTNTSESAYRSQKGDSSNFQVSTRWAPAQNLNLNFDYSQTESLGAVTSGFYQGSIGYGGYSPGLGSGYPGSIGGRYGTFGDLVSEPIGGGGGLPDEEEPEISQYTDSQTRVNLSWQPLSTLSLDANLGLRKYTSGGAIGYLADSDQRYGNLSVSWLPSQSLAFNASLGSDLLQFLDEGRGGVLNNSFTFSGSYRPLNSRLSYGLSVNKQWGVSPNYTGFGSNEVAELVDTNLFDVMANVEYRLAERASLVGRFGYSDFTGGFADFVKNTAEIGMQYQISNNFGLNFGWQFIKNDSRLPEPGDDGLPDGFRYQGEDYTTNLLVLSVTTNFQSTFAGDTRGQGPQMNRPIGPGIGMFSGYGGGFSGGLSPPAGAGGYSSMFGGTGGYGGGMGGLPFASSYGSYGSFGGSSFGSGLGGLGGGGSSYYGGGPSYYGGGSSYYGGGSSYYGGGSSYYGGGSGSYGSTYPGYGGAGGSYRPYSGYEGGGLEGFGEYDMEDYGDYGLGRPPGGGGGSPWSLGGPASGGPLGAPGSPNVLSQPNVGDPWAQGGQDAGYPIDDMRDV